MFSVGQYLIRNMLDLFAIFSKGGLVLWCFESTSQFFAPSVNALIRSVLLQERSSSSSLFTHNGLTIQYKLDNEFELVFVVAYQKILQLSYIDKFLNSIQLEFRDKYKNDILQGHVFNFDFEQTFRKVLQEVEFNSKRAALAPKIMKTYEQSSKSQKTVASMIEKKDGSGGGGGKANEKAMKESSQNQKKPVQNGTDGQLTDEMLAKNRQKLIEKHTKTKQKDKTGKSPIMRGESGGKKTQKKPKRQWDNCGTSKDASALDYSAPKPADALMQHGDGDDDIAEERMMSVGKMVGEIPALESESSEFDDEIEVEEDEVEDEKEKQQSNATKSGGFGMFNVFKSLVGSKTITREEMQEVLDKMRDHLIAKNVAADISDKLCNSVATKLEGKVLGTFSGLASTVKTSLTESCVQILSPKRRVDILRDVMEAQRHQRPYIITFCGVNGVGKSTNLAKVTFWLVENGFRVLIGACDTFRAGAVEQLRTHTKHLNALHPPDSHNGVQMVFLYEKGYGKDAAGIAMAAINYAKDTRHDVVLIDTAGRMQDNEPLMRSLAKLIKVNQPDLVLFVGEALVGNEAVDQLLKFNQALADFSSMDNPRLIDGIVLTKFDTIDDKVGAAISMTYSTGQPIVFIGTGQTYTDLKSLNAKAVVNALMKA